MTAEERAEMIESYRRAYETLTEALKEFPREMWHYRPDPQEWSIHDTVIHITDSEANSYVRCRRLIAEPGAQVMAYDENGWLKGLKYSEQSPEDALELFRWLRGNTYKLIKSLPEETWTHTVYHPENGTMTMDDWLHIYKRHIPEHVEQMRRVYRAWQSQRG